VGDPSRLTAAGDYSSLGGELSLSGRRLIAIPAEKVIRRGLQDARNPAQAAGCNARLAHFVFLDLLERHIGEFAQRRLAQTQTDAPVPDPCANGLVFRRRSAGIACLRH
jgi:hypothetical protein